MAPHVFKSTRKSELSDYPNDLTFLSVPTLFRPCKFLQTRITIKVQDIMGSRVYFKVKPTLTMGKLKTHYAMAKGAWHCELDGCTHSNTYSDSFSAAGTRRAAVYGGLEG